MKIITLSLFIAYSLHAAHSRAKREADPCENLTFCTIKPKDYPQKKINDMFKNYKVLHRPTPEKDLELQSRDGVEMDIKKDNCLSKVVIEPLYRVRQTTKDAWKTVIQIPKKQYQQTVRMEICDIGAKCFEDLPYQMIYTTRCVQKYMMWNIYVLAGDGYENRTVSLPSCCSCYYNEE